MTIRFFGENTLDDVSIRFVRGHTGLYFVYLVSISIPYPFRSSRLIYIGMSESKQNTIGNRLRDHKSGQSGNAGLTNYISTRDVRFTYLAFEILEALGANSVAELESLFLTNFLCRHGSYPICNNQAGAEVKPGLNQKHIVVDWTFFD
jgi:hypothetical protein